VKKTIFRWIQKNKTISEIVASLLLRRRNSFLKEIGWFNSFNKSVPINKNGEAIPWYTYCVINFIESRINKEMNVFEYGSGNSTIWWAERVNSVVSCEHNKKWFSFMKIRLPVNVEYLYYDLGA